MALSGIEWLFSFAELRSELSGSGRGAPAQGHTTWFTTRSFIRNFHFHLHLLKQYVAELLFIRAPWERTLLKGWQLVYGRVLNEGLVVPVEEECQLTATSSQPENS